MKHSMTMFIAHTEINSYMKMFDMRADFKWFVEPKIVSFTTTSEINEKYFLNIIEESKKQTDWWIPAIKYMDNFFLDSGVKVLSNGFQELFVETGEVLNE